MYLVIDLKNETPKEFLFIYFFILFIPVERSTVGLSCVLIQATNFSEFRMSVCHATPRAMAHFKGKITGQYAV